MTTTSARWPSDRYAQRIALGTIAQLVSGLVGATRLVSESAGPSTAAGLLVAIVSIGLAVGIWRRVRGAAAVAVLWQAIVVIAGLATEQSFVLRLFDIAVLGALVVAGRAIFSAHASQSTHVSAA